MKSYATGIIVALVVLNAACSPNEDSNSDATTPDSGDDATSQTDASAAESGTNESGADARSDVADGGDGGGPSDASTDAGYTTFFSDTGINALTADSNYLYVGYSGTRRGIVKIPLAGGSPVTVVANANVGQTHGLANDATNVYWFESVTLMKAPIAATSQNGTGMVSAVFGTSPASDGTNVYLVDQNFTIIRRVAVGVVDAGFNGGQTFVTGQTAINSLSFDTVHGYLYWGDTNEVRRAPLTTSDAAAFENYENTSPTELKVIYDNTASVVVWRTSKEIYRRGVGDTAGVLRASTTVIADVAVQGDAIVYAVQGGLYRVNASGGSPTLVANEPGSVQNLVLAGNRAYWLVAAANEIHTAPF